MLKVAEEKPEKILYMNNNASCTEYEQSVRNEISEVTAAIRRIHPLVYIINRMGRGYHVQWDRARSKPQQCPRATVSLPSSALQIVFLL